VRAHRLTLSRLSLASKCLYGFRGDITVVPRLPGNPAKVGSCVHNIVARRRRSDLPIEEYSQDIRNMAQPIADGPIEAHLQRTAWLVVEQGFLYNAETDTTELGPRRGEPGYDDVEPMQIRGTVDFVAAPSMTLDGNALVEDLKTGKPPEDSHQLYGQAVTVSRRFNWNRVRVRYARALKTKMELLNEEVLDIDRLDEEAGRIRGLLRMLPTSEPTPGDHCWKCDAWQVCPAKAADRQAYAAARDEGESRLYDDNVRLFG
jgi:hypothetical protein